MFLLQQTPVIVRVVEEPVKQTGWGDVILSAIGLVGVLLIAAAVLGAVLGAVLIGVKRWRATHGLEHDPVTENPLTITPASDQR